MLLASRIFVGPARMAVCEFSTVTAAQVKKLREMTDAPILSCKQALMDPEVSGDYEKAVHWLRKRGIAAAESKSNRRTGEGVVVMRLGSDRGTLVEMNTESDLISRNAQFQVFANRVADLCFQNALKSVDDVLKSSLEATTVSESLAALKYHFGENITISRVRHLPLPKAGCLEGYVHNALGSSIGQIGSLVTLYYPKTDKEAQIREIASLLALHVAAAHPVYRDSQSLSKESLERVIEGFNAEVRKDLKPEAVKPFLLSKLKTFYADKCLLSQPHMLVDKNPVVGEYLKAKSKELGVPIELGHFLRFKVGESE